jgi:putative tricarboxylic transport membrane protein
MNKKFDRYAGVFFLAIAAFFIVESQKISTNAYGSSVGPNIFPLGIGIILGILSIRLIFETFKYQKGEMENESLDYKRFAIILGAAILYCLFLADVGYAVTTFLFLFVSFQAMKKGKVLMSLLIAASFSLGVFFVFNNLLNVPLPSSSGWLGIL